MNLYKYTKVEFAKQALAGNYIYLASPKQFNDVYDSSLGFHIEDFEYVLIAEYCAKLKIGDLSFIDIAKRVKALSNIPTNTAYERYMFIKEFLSDDHFSMIKMLGIEDQKDIFDSLLNQATKKLDIEPNQADLDLIEKLKVFDFKHFGESAIEPFKDKLEMVVDIINGYYFRVGCFTESCKSNYMWALYAENFKGICLEYDFDTLKSEAEGDIFKIKYSKNRPIIHTETLLDYIDKKVNSLENLEVTMNKILTTKHEEFKNEKEWRIIKFNIDYKMKTNALRKIYLGYSLQKEDIAFFKSYCKANNIELWQLKINNTSYDLRFDMIVL